jgi:RNase P/RNase MRP subunit p29
VHGGAPQTAGDQGRAAAAGDTSTRDAAGRQWPGPAGGTCCGAAAAGKPLQLQAALPPLQQQHEQFPYRRLAGGLLSGPLAARLRLPPPEQPCHGTVGDLLEPLMVRNMAAPVARAMLATRTVDKNLLLDNPTASLKALVPQGPGGGAQRRQRPAARLAPRAFRQAAARVQPEKGGGGGSGAGSGGAGGSGPEARGRLAATALDGAPTFAALQPLHELWQRYVWGLLSGGGGGGGGGSAGSGGAQSAAEAEALLAGADLHGVLLTVAAHRAALHAGCAGIVAKDTMRTFQIVAADDRLHVVPKQGGTFTFELPHGALPPAAARVAGGATGQRHAAAAAAGGARVVTLDGGVLVAAAEAAGVEAAKRAGGSHGRAATTAAARRQRQAQQRQKQLQQREQDRARRERAGSSGTQRHTVAQSQHQRRQAAAKREQQWKADPGRAARPSSQGPEPPTLKFLTLS